MSYPRLKKFAQNILYKSYKTYFYKYNGAKFSIDLQKFRPTSLSLKTFSISCCKRINPIYSDGEKPILCSYIAKTSQSHSHRNSYFSPKYLIFSLTFPFFGSRKDEDEKDNEIITMMKLAILATQRGELAKAEQLLHVALKGAQEMNDQKAVTYIFDLLANLALQREDYKKAEKLFIDVLKRFLASGMPDDENAIVEVSLKLSNIYSNLGEVDKACEGFLFCIATQESKLKALGEENVDEDTLVLWAMSHDWFARFLLDMGHYDRAKKHFSRAFDVCVKVKGEEDPQVAVLLSDLGAVCALQQKYDEAIDYMEKAIHIAKLSKSEDLASFYVNLGTVYMQKKVFDDAEEYCKEGRKIAKAGENEEALKEASVCLETINSLKK